MDLTRALAEFDGRHAASLRRVAADFDDQNAAELIRLCQSEYSVAATWVVKVLLEAGRARAIDLEQVFGTLDVDALWEASLHVLQMVHLAPDAALAQVFTIRALLTHPKTLVRVWAMDAFVHVALAEPVYLPDARAIVARVGDQDPAFMRARARHLQDLLDQSSL